MKALRRCRNSLEADNVVLIDVDTYDFNNVIDLDLLESLTKMRGGTSGLTNDKNSPSRTYINIDDDESPSERKYENGASSSWRYDQDTHFEQENISPFKISKGKRTYGLSTQSESESDDEDSSDDENLDCEVLKDSLGKLREEWERAFLKRKGDVNNDHINKNKQKHGQDSGFIGPNVDVENDNDYKDGIPFGELSFYDDHDATGNVDVDCDKTDLPAGKTSDEHVEIEDEIPCSSNQKENEKDDSPIDDIIGREKHKKTEEYKRAQEEELTATQIALKIQKNLRMHPSMYGDPIDRSTSRRSQRLISIKETQQIPPSRKLPPQDSSKSSSSGSPTDRDLPEHSFFGYNLKRKRTPLGRAFQARLPDLPDTKWLGTQIWPLEKNETRSSLIQLDRIGKGRQDSCGCQFQGSLECVKFHINEKRNCVKLELGSAFYKWKFNEMGENVAVNWTRDEEKKFEEIIKAMPSSSGITFWGELQGYFGDKKSMRVMVSYYFNVYLLRRRAHQNRSDPSNIDSDDDELEKIENEANKNGVGSILCSPKKVHLNAR